MTTLKDLAVPHDYYCSPSNYVCKDAHQHYDDMKDFLDEWEEMDIDYNLMFRWDVYEKCDEGEEGYYAECFFMLQSKGYFIPCHIENFNEEDVERFVNFARKHKAKIDSIWKPL